MPKTKISEYSATANSNTDVASINIDEGCAPSGINNAIRAVMGHLKDFQQGTNGDPFNGPVNGTVGATTPSTGAFTTLTTTGTINLITVGRGAGAVSTNTAVGYQAQNATATLGSTTAVGYQAAYSNTGAEGLTYIGRWAGYSTTTGSNNTSVGVNSLFSNTTGANNVANGHSALFSNTTASNNTAVGYQAGYAQTTADGNALFGYQAGTGLTTGNLNSFFGAAAGGAITTGTKNTIVGRYNGNQGGLNITTASNYIVLSDGDGNPRGIFDSSGNLMVGVTSALGKFSVLQGSSSNGDTVVLKASTASAAGSQPGVKFLSNADANLAQVFADVNSGALITNVNGSERARIKSAGEIASASAGSFGIRTAVTAGAGTTTGIFVGARSATAGDTGSGTDTFIVWSNGNVVNTNNSYGAISDVKLKENIVDATPKLEKLNQVRVVNYNFIGDQQKQLGVVAQELEQIFPGMIDESPDKDVDGNDLGTVTKSVKYSVFVPMLIKALQEQQAIIQSLTARITALEGASA